MCDSPRSQRLERELREEGWSIRWAAFDVGSVVEARRIGGTAEDVARWAWGETPPEALEELLAIVHDLPV